MMDALEKSNLSKFSEVNCNELSTGWKKILQIFVASLAKVDLLILDEPFNCLDIIAQEILKREIIKTKERVGTVLLSTHLISIIEELAADHLTIIKMEKTFMKGPLMKIH